MSVMRQSVQGAGSVVMMLCSCPGLDGLLAAGIVNGPYIPFLRVPGRLGMSPRGSLNDAMEVIELACAGAVIAAVAHRQTIAVASPISLIIVPSPPFGRLESSPNWKKCAGLFGAVRRLRNEDALHREWRASRRAPTPRRAATSRAALGHGSGRERVG